MSPTSYQAAPPAEECEFCQKQMLECDRQVEQYRQQREDRSKGTPLPEEKRKGRLKKKKGNAPQFDLRGELFRMSGVDLTQIDSIDVMTATTILSEVGWDMGKWETEHHFVSWLRLCPDNRISGDKIIGKGRLPTKNRVSISLKMAASTLRRSNTYLRAQFRRFRTKLGSPIAIKAMAAKLARLVYRMLRHGMKYVDQGPSHHGRRANRGDWRWQDFRVVSGGRSPHTHRRAGSGCNLIDRQELGGGCGRQSICGSGAHG